MNEIIKKCLTHLKNGETILYPTDTIVGIGCDATNIDAIKKISKIKNRSSDKAYIILVCSDAMLNRYIDEVPAVAWDIIDCSEKPVTIVYSNPKNLPKELLSEDGSIAIRVVKEGFCQKLIYQFNKPIISTSANLSDATTPSTIHEVTKSILQQVDYVVDLRIPKTKNVASSIIKIGISGEVEIIRK